MSVPIRPKKWLGQHFLIDDAIAQRIAASLHAEAGIALEVGAGTGALTKHLLIRNDLQLYAVEPDHEAINHLAKHLPAILPHLFVTDFLTMNLNTLMPDKYSIIGNFPYNISSQIFFKILDHREHISEVVGMLQQEVALRLTAQAGNRACGILSVLLQAYYNIEYLFSVDASAFEPVPKVQSAVIRLKRNSTTQLPCNEALFKTIIKTTFNQRRKTIRNSLKSIIGKHNTESTELPMLNMRPEQLSVQDFILLTNAVETIYNQ